MPKSLENKKIAMVIAFRDFRDIEYFIPRDILQRVGAKLINISSQKGIAIGADGGEVEVNLVPAEFKAGNFEAVLFIGGSGMAKKLDDQDFQRIGIETAKANNVLGAICIAPALLAKAGVLEGKKATVWSSPLQKSPIRILERGGAIYQDANVVIDGKIVTANGPAAAKDFTEAIIKVLTEQ